MIRKPPIVKVEVTKPSKGLFTRFPSDKLDPAIIVEAQNVRAEKGVLKAAPGYERIIPAPRNLDSPANLIFQSNILNTDEEIRTTPIIGTSQKLYTVRRRSKELVCQVGGGGGSVCSFNGAFFGDSGRSTEAGEVAELVKSWTPDSVFHLGDMVYGDRVIDPAVPDYEESIGQYWYDYLGGYNGLYGIGPAQNKFFPCLGNHDYDDETLIDFYNFFNHAANPNKRYYSVKRGPCHFIVMNGYDSVKNPDGVGVGFEMEAWALDQAQNSDCSWVFLIVHFPAATSDINYYPGIATTAAWRVLPYVSAIISGHAHNMEVIQTDDYLQLVCGSGGRSLRAFHDPLVDGSEWADNTHYGALRLSATHDEAVFSFYDTDGNVLHTKTLSTPRAGGSDICYIGDIAKAIFTLEVRPPFASAEVGFSWPYRAYANYVDGTVEEVTDLCLWTSSDDTIAALAPTGVATGISPGEITVTAAYLDHTATAQFEVLHSCLDDPIEVVFTLARNTSMGAPTSGLTVFECAKEGIRQSLDHFDSTTDKAGLVSYAGTFASQTEDAVLDQPLTDQFELVNEAASLLVADGAKSLPEALRQAYLQLTSGLHTDGNQRAVVVILDGPGDIVDPGGDPSSDENGIAAAMAEAAVQANAIKALTRTYLVVIGFNIPDAYRSDLVDLVSGGYYYGVSTGDELISMLAGLSNALCYYDGDYYYYQPPPDDDPCNKPVADYRNLINWEILRGCVDLAGSGPNGEFDSTAWDPRPGNRFYLDMIGTNVDNSPAHDTTCGKIRLRDGLPFVSGVDYKLSFYICNYAIPRSITVWIEDESGNVKVVPQTYTPAIADFVLKEISFTADLSFSGKIVFDSEVVAPAPPIFTWPKQGVLLDRVKVEDITNSTEMFYDDFDDENPC